MSAAYSPRSDGLLCTCGPQRTLCPACQAWQARQRHAAPSAPEHPRVSAAAKRTPVRALTEDEALLRLEQTYARLSARRPGRWTGPWTQEEALTLAVLFRLAYGAWPESRHQRDTAWCQVSHETVRRLWGSRCAWQAALREAWQARGLPTLPEERAPLCALCGLAYRRSNRRPGHARCLRRQAPTARIPPGEHTLDSYYQALRAQWHERPGAGKQGGGRYRREELLILGCLFRQAHGRWPAPAPERSKGDFQPWNHLPGIRTIIRHFGGHDAYLAACQAYAEENRL